MMEVRIDKRFINHVVKICICQSANLVYTSRFMRRMAHKLRAILPIFIEKSLSDKQVTQLRLSPSYRPFRYGVFS